MRKPNEITVAELVKILKKYKKDKKIIVTVNGMFTNFPEIWASNKTVNIGEKWG